MKIKEILQQSLILLCLLTKLSYANLSDLIHDDPWKFMRYKFITNPEAMASRALPTIAKTIFGTAIGVGTGWATKEICENYLEIPGVNFSNYDDFKEFVSAGSKYAFIPAAIISGYLIYYRMHKALVGHYQHKQLIDLLNNWPTIKSRVPYNLQQGFEKIYQDYKRYPSEFTDKADDILRVLTEQIHEKFETKGYQRFWNAKILHGNIFLDIGKTLISFINIFK